MRREPYRVTYALLQLFFGTVFWLLTGLRIEGRHHVPRHGAVLVVSNHLHNLDPVLLGVAVPRPLAFMAKIELFGVPLLGGIMRFHRAFPVDRGAADRQAVRTALARLAEGHALGIFPEGTRSRSASLRRGLPGVGLIAARSGVPIVPVAISGSDRLLRLWPRPTVTVRIGPPIALPAGVRLSHQEAADRIMEAVAALLPEAYRGVYASPPVAAQQSLSPVGPGVGDGATGIAEPGRAEEAQRVSGRRPNHQ